MSALDVHSHRNHALTMRYQGQIMCSARLHIVGQNMTPWIQTETSWWVLVHPIHPIDEFINTHVGGVIELPIHLKKLHMAFSLTNDVFTNFAAQFGQITK